MTQKEKDFIDFLDRHPPLLFLFIFLFPFIWIAEKLSFFIKTILQSGKKKAKEGEHNT